MSIRSFKRAHARRIARDRRRLANAKRRGTLVAGAALSASALMASTAQAADNYTVTTNGDGAGSCVAFSCTTLRAALTAANADATASTISFANTVASPITVATPLPITEQNALAINGPGAGALTVSGGGVTQIFNITATSPSPPPSSPTEIEISGLTIANGSSSAPGGAIENLPPSGHPAALTLTNDAISGSTSTSSNGGGGIYSGGPLTISGSTITGNTASAGNGGGIRAISASTNDLKYTAVISGSTITGNTGQSGGGLAAGSSSPFGGVNALISASHITGNHAPDISSNGLGGGVIASGGSLELSGSTVSGNTSHSAGGGVFSATKYGTGIASSTISGNTSGSGSSGNGGGLEIIGYSGYPGQVAKYNPVHVLNTTISGNQAPRGAGIDVAGLFPGSSVKVQASTITGNHGGTNSFGGGLMVDKYVYGAIQLVDSTITGNAATHGGGIGLSYNGTERLLAKNGKGSISFENSTIAANAASAASGGGGIYLGQYNGNKSGVASIVSTIVSGNTAAGAANDLARPATSTSGGFDGAFSLIQAPGGAPMLSSKALIEGVSPQLGALGTHGGPTQTMLPSGTSPVIDQGHAPSALSADQRGGPRTINVAGLISPPGGDGTDIGAVELPASGVIVPTAGLSAKIHGKLLGGPKTPLLAGTSTPVKCAVRIGTLASCVIEVRSTSGKLLADGLATSSQSPKSLSPKVSLTDAGRSALAHNALGLIGRATVVASTSRSGSQTIAGKVRLLGPSITLALGKRSSKLSKPVLGELDRVAKLLASAKSITCTAYSDKGNGDGSLTSSQAKAACARLVKDGFKGKVRSVGKGHSQTVASPGSKKNRRLVITFSL